MKCRVGELGFDSVLFRWLKVSLMIREAACQSILSSPSAMLGEYLCNAGVFGDESQRLVRWLRQTTLRDIPIGGSKRL